MTRPKEPEFRDHSTIGHRRDDLQYKKTMKLYNDLSAQPGWIAPMLAYILALEHYIGLRLSNWASWGNPADKFLDRSMAAFALGVAATIVVVPLIVAVAPFAAVAALAPFALYFTAKSSLSTFNLLWQKFAGPTQNQDGTLRKRTAW